MNRRIVLSEIDCDFRKLLYCVNRRTLRLERSPARECEVLGGRRKAAGREAIHDRDAVVLVAAAHHLNGGVGSMF